MIREILQWAMPVLAVFGVPFVQMAFTSDSYWKLFLENILVLVVITVFVFGLIWLY